jgi:hypothetical protein
MSVNAISSLVSSYVQKVTGGGTSPQGATTVASAAQEASETLDTTTKEAQHGDAVARQKLQQLQAKQQQNQAAPSSPSEPGKGDLVDHHA